MGSSMPESVPKIGDGFHSESRPFHRYEKDSVSGQIGPPRFRLQHMNTEIIEPLENRIAPASVLTFTDLDGDNVKVISSAGDLNAAGVAAFDPAGHQLFSLTLAGATFKGANIQTIVQKAAGGDGLVNIGLISASGNDLGKVIIKGDLGTIFCGDGDAATGPGLKFLSVGSMGQYGNFTQGGTGDLLSVVEGSLGTLLVRGDLVGATIGARNFSDASDGKITKIVIGGSIFGKSALRGGIFTTGDIGSLSIGGNLVGGEGNSAGQVSCGQKLQTLKIAGSILGNDGVFSGTVEADEIGIARIGRDLEAGTGTMSGAIIARQKIGSITVNGSVIGGKGEQAFTLNTTSAQGQIISFGDIVALKIAGDLVGREGKAGGTIQALGNVGSIVIAGSLVGGSGPGSGKIDVFGDLAKLKIGGAVVGGSGPQNDFIAGGINHEGQVFALGDIGAVKIGGGVFGGNGIATGEVRSGGDLASIQIGGSLVGGVGLAGGQLASGGDMGKVQIRGDVIGGQSSFTGFIISAGAIDSLTIGRSVAGGSAGRTGEIQAVGAIGKLKLGGSLFGGSISGTQGTLDTSGFIHASRIGDVSIGGSVVSGIDTSTGGALLNNASLRVTTDIGKITVKGSILGNETADGTTLVVISARGQAVLAPAATSDLAIGSLTVGGSMQFTNVLAGFDQDDSVFTGSNGNASVGPVKVGGNWIASNLTAGVQDGGLPGFATPGDTVINNPAGAATDAIVARIASITIKGLVVGTPTNGSIVQFGFTAQQIGSFKSLGFKATLTNATDAAIPLSPTTGDMALREV
jgi:hypothetical protein